MVPAIAAAPSAKKTPGKEKTPAPAKTPKVRVQTFLQGGLRFRVVQRQRLTRIEDEESSSQYCSPVLYKV
jgi:hypothetical protein